MSKLLTPRLAVLSLGHLTVDAYSSFFTPLLPLLVQRLDLSLTKVGALVALASVASSFSQPLFGWLSDRLHRPWFIAFGPLVAACTLSMVGLAPSYVALIAVLMIGGMGVAAFHPQAAVLARESSDSPGLAMSTFVTGGTLGFALGPLFAVTLVGRFGLERTWLALFPGLVMCVLLLFWFSRVSPRARHASGRPTLGELRPQLRPLTLLYFAVVSRSAVSYGFMTFLPIHLHARGFSLASGGLLTTAYLVAGASGGFLGGWLAERWGGRRVVRLSFLIAAPLFFGFVLLPNVPGLVCLIAGGFALQTSLPVNVVLGQELSPRHASTISSLLMGAAWGLGAMLIGPIGALADHFGLRVALLALACVCAAGFACAIALPDIRRAAVVPHSLPTVVDPTALGA